MKTLEQADKSYTENSVRAFLKGRASENWILGILRASSPQYIQNALQTLSYHSNTPRLDFLRRACGVV